METLPKPLLPKSLLFLTAGAALAGVLANGCSSNDGTGYDTDAGDDGSTDVTPDSGGKADTGTKADSGGHPADSGGGNDATVNGDDSGNPQGGGDGGLDSATTPDTGTITTSEDAAVPQPIGAWNFDDQTQTVDAGGVDSGSDSGGSTDASDDGSADAGTAADAATSDDASIDASAPDAGTDASTGSGGQDASTGPLSAADVSGHGHPALFQGSAKFGPGKSGGGLVLDGTTNCFADVGLALIDTTKSFSVTTWTNFSVVSNWEVALSQDVTHGSLFGLKLRGDNNFYDFDIETSDIDNPGFVVAQSTTLGVANTWVHLTGVYDATAVGGQGALTIYVNGTAQATAVVGQSLGAATGHFVIGRGLYNDGIGSWNTGTLDDVAVYDVALSGAQVAAIYNAQK